MSGIDDPKGGIDEIINMQDIEKFNFMSELRSDPAKFNLYVGQRREKLIKETMERKRAGFQKAQLEMGRYFDMDHHARFYNQRNADLGNAQEMLLGFMKNNTSSLRMDLDNSKRQFQVNDWYAYNKLETLFFLQIALIALTGSMLFIIAGRANVFTPEFTNFAIAILIVGAAATGAFRTWYTNSVRNVMYWNKRKFDYNRGSGDSDQVCFKTGTKASE